jgi:hypothetical protein
MCGGGELFIDKLLSGAVDVTDVGDVAENSGFGHREPVLEVDWVYRYRITQERWSSREAKTSSCKRSVRIGFLDRTDIESGTGCDTIGQGAWFVDYCHGGLDFDRSKLYGNGSRVEQQSDWNSQCRS